MYGYGIRTRLRIPESGLNIEKIFGTIDGLLEAFMCKGTFANQSALGYTPEILSPLQRCCFIPAQGGYQYRILIQCDARPT